MSGVAGLLALVALAAGAAVVVATVLTWPVLRQLLGGLAMRGRATPVELALAAPMLAIMSVPLLCLAPSVAALLAPSLDHCMAHEGHALHLCLTHLPVVSAGPITVGLASFVGLLGLMGAGAVSRAIEFGRVATRLRQVGTQHPHEDVTVLATERCMVFTLGLVHPRVFVSEGLRQLLAPDHWRAVLAHERAHARRRDPLRGLILRAVSRLHLPVIRRHLLDLRDLAVERHCDEAAAEHSGDRISVAETLLALERLAVSAPRGAAAAAAVHLEQRVRALLDGSGRTGPWHRRAGWLVLPAMLAAADPVHHLSEHLLEHWLF